MKKQKCVCENYSNARFHRAEIMMVQTVQCSWSKLLSQKLSLLHDYPMVPRVFTTTNQETFTQATFPQIQIKKQLFPFRNPYQFQHNKRCKYGEEFFLTLVQLLLNLKIQMNTVKEKQNLHY